MAEKKVSKFRQTSTYMGILTLALAGLSIYRSGTVDQQSLATILAGIGLIKADEVKPDTKEN